MKKRIQWAVIIAAVFILIISIALHGIFCIMSANEINNQLIRNAAYISQEISETNYDNIQDNGNIAITSSGTLVYGHEKSIFYPSAKIELSNGDELTVYSNSPIYAYMLIILALLIFLSAIGAVIISSFSVKRTASEINEQLKAVADGKAIDNEELAPLAQIISQREELERLNDSSKSEKHRREFTANVSHELKTPLTTISGTAEILKSGLVKPEDIPHFAENIYSETQRMITLVNDIIKLSQLDENEIPLDNEPIDLYDLASDNIGWLKDEADKNNITIIQQGQHVKIRGVHQILDEMVHNLCDNAIKYNKPGGRMIVSTCQKEGKAIISIKDTGIGIPKKHQEHVFERFYRVDKSHSREIGGTGLGLSIVKHGASFHNATVSLNSVEGIGTEVTLSFNLA